MLTSEKGHRAEVGPACAEQRTSCARLPLPSPLTRASAAQQQQRAPAMAPSPFADLLGDTLLRGGKPEPTAAALHGKTVGIYFSAHWCPPCVPAARRGSERGASRARQTRARVWALCAAGARERYARRRASSPAMRPARAYRQPPRGAHPPRARDAALRCGAVRATP